MKDYSEFMKNEYGFITNINIDKENNCIEVMTSKSKKGEPHIYNLTKENLNKLYKRLENQYKLLIENSEEIYENNKNKKLLVSTFITACIITSLILSAISLFLTKLLPLLLSVVLSLTCISVYEILKNQQKKYKEMIELYKFYLENSKEMEEYIKKDLNIQSQIKDKTAEVISLNEELQNEELIDNIYDINLMDKLSLKELKNMLLRYKISKALDEEPYYESESLEEIEDTNYELLEEKTKKKIK